MTRAYVPYREKHKWPKGFGSLCPATMPETEAASLLEKAIEVPGVGANKLWVASGEWCFCAHPSPHAGASAWHGFPVVGGDVDERVWTALREANIVTHHEIRRLRRQRELPSSWP